MALTSLRKRRPLQKVISPVRRPTQTVVPTPTVKPPVWSISPPPPHKTATPVPPAATAPAPAPAPSTPATPAAPPGLPTLPGAQAKRIAADQAYTAAQAQHDSQMYQAALRLGDLNLIHLLAGRGYGADVTEAPSTGDYANIERQREDARKSIGENRNAAGTFFSGMHADDLSKNEQAAQDARTEALNRYNEAQANLEQMLIQAGIDKGTAYGDADQMEWDYAQAHPPEPSEPAPTAPIPGAGLPPGAATQGGGIAGAVPAPQADSGWVQAVINSNPALAPQGDAIKKLWLDQAMALWKKGIRTGKQWRGIIDALGYDPRDPRMGFY